MLAHCLWCHSLGYHLYSKLVVPKFSNNPNLWLLTCRLHHDTLNWYVSRVRKGFYSLSIAPQRHPDIPSPWTDGAASTVESSLSDCRVVTEVDNVKPQPISRCNCIAIPRTLRLSEHRGKLAFTLSSVSKVNTVNSITQFRIQHNIYNNSLIDFVFLLLARDSSSKLGSPLARSSVL